jgi:hypothetical protein
MVVHAALGSSLVFGSPHHHNTTGKVEHMNGFKADVLRSFANERGDDWPALVPLVEIAIDDSASPLGSGYTPFYADRGHTPAARSPSPRRPTPQDQWATARLLLTSWRARQRRFGCCCKNVRSDARQSSTCTGGTCGSQGDEVLLDTEHMPLPSRSLLSPRWMGPFTLTPNTYHLDM